jgi:hypothetical protein
VLNKTISRRGFLKSAALLSTLAIPAQLLAQSAASTSVANQKIKMVVSEIGNNHGHEFTMTLDDLTKGGEMNYSIQGKSGHPHFIRITTDMLAKLNQGQNVSFISSTDAGHSHQVNLSVIVK